MSKQQDIDTALYDLETALSIISDNVVMPVSGNIYPFYKSAKGDLERAKKALEGLHDHPFKEDVEMPKNAEMTSCYCSTTNFPPCGFCTKEE